MSWWGKLQRSLHPDSLKKAAVKSAERYNNLAKGKTQKLNRQVSKKAIDYRDQLSKQASDYGTKLSKQANDYGKQATNELKRSASDYGKRYRAVPENLRLRSLELSKQAQQRAAKTVADLTKQATDTARSIPVKTAEAAKGAAAMGTQAAKNAAQAGTQAAADTGKRYANHAFNAIPDVKGYASLAGWRIVYVLFGAAFLYGLGASVPGAVSRYYIERDRRRDEEERTLNRDKEKEKRTGKRGWDDGEEDPTPFEHSR